MPYFSPFKDDHSKKCCTHTHANNNNNLPLRTYTECCKNDSCYFLFDRFLKDVWENRNDIVPAKVFTHLRTECQEPYWKNHLILELKATLVTQNAHYAEKEQRGREKNISFQHIKKMKYAYTERASLWTVFSFLSSSHSTQLTHSQTTTH